MDEILDGPKLRALFGLLIRARIADEETLKLLRSSLPAEVAARIPVAGKPDECLRATLRALNDPWVVDSSDRLCLVEYLRDIRMNAGDKRELVERLDDFICAALFRSTPAVAEWLRVRPVRWGPEDDPVPLQLQTEHAPDPLTLDALLRIRRGREAATGCWLVHGPAGAGKSTIARHVARRAGSSGDVIPIYIDLSEYPEVYPFDHAQQALTRRIGKAAAAGLDTGLAELGQEDGRVWVLLDGADQLEPSRLAAEVRHWGEIARLYRGVRIAIFCRDPHAAIGEPFQPAAIQPLGEQRDALLARLLSGQPEHQAWLSGQLRPGSVLHDLSQTPLLLTLMANAPGVSAQSRAGLLEWAVQTALKDRFGDRWRSVGRVLEAFAHRLWAGADAQWTAGRFEAVIRELKTSDSEVDRAWREDGLSDPGALLTELEGTLLVRRRGDADERPGRPGWWVFNHQLMLELLVAAHLERRGVEAIADAAGGPLGEGLGRRLGAIVGACTALPEGERPAAFEGLFARHPSDVSAILAECAAHRGPAVLARLLSATSGWHGAHLLDALRTIETRRGPLDACCEALIDRIPELVGLEQKALVFGVLEQMGRAPDLADFCARAGLARPGHHGVQFGDWIEDGGRAFALSRVPITVKDFARMTGDDAVDDARPKTDLTGWVARLYVRWIGGRLPTVAEWRRACLGGQRGPYWFDVDSESIDASMWHAGNARFALQDVGLKAPNGYGLHDMHGLVYEWCAPDETAPAGRMPVCGGAFWLSAGHARIDATRLRDIDAGYFDTGVRVLVERMEAAHD